MPTLNIQEDATPNPYIALNGDVVSVLGEVGSQMGSGLTVYTADFTTNGTGSLFVLMGPTTPRF